MRVLWLASWYPNKLTPYNGDFIKRHAEAVSLYETVDVIYVIRDTAGNVTRTTLVEKTCNQNFTETIIYYYTPTLRIEFFDKLISHFWYLKCFKKNIKAYLKTTGKPDLVHVHVAIKVGSIARWVKQRFAVPYLVTEHWTGYLPEAEENFCNLNRFVQKDAKKTFTNALGVSTVSNHLGIQLKKLFPTIHYLVIPNVVNTSVFFPAPHVDSNIYRFIHISGLSSQKNVELLVRAAALVKKEFIFQLSIVGPFTKKHVQLAKKFRVDEFITFQQELPQPFLAKLLQQADALILFSRYETFGCVIIEANACGLPVLVSNIPVFHEIVEQGTTGIIATENSYEALAEEMKSFIKNEHVFFNRKIAEKTAGLYSYEVVGKRISEWYKENMS